MLLLLIQLPAFTSPIFSYHSISSNLKESSSNSHRLQVRTFFWGWLCTHARHMSVMKGAADLSHQGLVFTIIKHNGHPLTSTIIIKHHQSVSLTNTIIHHYQTLLFTSIKTIIINHGQASLLTVLIDRSYAVEQY